MGLIFSPNFSSQFNLYIIFVIIFRLISNVLLGDSSHISLEIIMYENRFEHLELNEIFSTHIESNITCVKQNLNSLDLSNTTFPKDTYISCYLHNAKDLYIFKSNNITYYKKFSLSEVLDKVDSFFVYVRDNQELDIISIKNSSNLLVEIYRAVPRVDGINFDISKHHDVLNTQIIHYVGSGISNNYFVTMYFTSTPKKKIHFDVYNISQELIFNKNNETIVNDIDSNTISAFCINREEDQILLCLNYRMPKCEFYSIKENKFNQTPGIPIEQCATSIKNFYFEETKEYVIVCENKDKELIIYRKRNNRELKFNNTQLYNVFNISYSIEDWFVKYDPQKVSYNLYLFVNGDAELIYSCTAKPDLIEDDLTNIINNYKYENNLNLLLDNLTNFIQGMNFDKDFNYYEGDNYEFILKDIDYITYNHSFINFSKCLKHKTHFNLIQVELKDENEYSGTNQIIYRVLDKYYNEVDIENCTSLDVYYTPKEVLNVKNIEYYQKKEVNIFNYSESFFQTICYVIDTDRDIPLGDRTTDIYQRYNVCDDNCTYQQLFKDSERNITEKIFCKCDYKYKNIFYRTVRNEIKIESKETPDCISSLKCYKLVISSDDKNNNIPFYLFTFMVGSHFPLWCYYMSTGVVFLGKYLSNEMVNFGYKKNKKITQKHVKNALNKNNLVTKVAAPTNKSVKKSANISNNNDMISKTPLDIQEKKLIPKKEEDEYASLSKRLLLKQAFGFDAAEVSKKYKNYNLINIDLKNPPKDDLEPPQSNDVLDNYTYEEAIKYDKRSFFRIFSIILKSEDILISTFLNPSPFKQVSIRAFALLFVVGSTIFFNTFFYSNEKIELFYKYDGNIFSFTLKYNLKIIFISFGISYLLSFIIGIVTSYSKNIRKIFQEEESKIRNDKNYVVTEGRKRQINDEIESILNCIKLRNLGFVSFDVVIMIFYWYYLTAFSHAFTNTQYNILLDSFFSLVIMFVVNIIFCLILTILYKLSISSNLKIIYQFVRFMYYL